MSQPVLQHIRWDDVPTESLNPLLDRQYIVGHHVMIARLQMKKGGLVPTHSHHNEQVTQIVSGVLQFTIDGKALRLTAGEFLFIPPNLPHSVLVVEDTVAIDTFTPPRQDWLDGSDSYLRG